MRKPPLCLHIPPLHLTKPTNPLLPQPTTFLAASTAFKAQWVKEQMCPSITNREGGLWCNCLGSCSFRSHHCTNEKNTKVVVAATATVFEMISCSLPVHHSQVKRASRWACQNRQPDPAALSEGLFGEQLHPLGCYSGPKTQVLTWERTSLPTPADEQWLQKPKLAQGIFCGDPYWAYTTAADKTCCVTGFFSTIICKLPKPSCYEADTPLSYRLLGMK